MTSQSSHYDKFFHANKLICHNILLKNLINLLVFILQSIIIIITILFYYALEKIKYHGYFESVHCYPPSSKCPKQPDLNKFSNYSSLNVFLYSSNFTSMTNFITKSPVKFVELSIHIST